MHVTVKFNSKPDSLSMIQGTRRRHLLTDERRGIPIENNVKFG